MFVARCCSMYIIVSAARCLPQPGSKETKEQCWASANEIAAWGLGQDRESGPVWVMKRLGSLALAEVESGS